MSGDSSQVFVIVRAPNGDVREFPIGETASVIGRDDSCDIRVDDRKVSRRHAAFRLIDGQPWAEDLGSVNGIKLNGKKINGRALVLDGDVVQVGGYEVRLKPVTKAAVRTAKRERERAPSPPTNDTMGMRVAPPETGRAKEDGAPRLLLFGQTKPVAGRRFPLGFGESIVGRLEDCAVPILDGSVSRQHARLVLSADAATVTDLGSSNGTFVNDVRIDRAELTDGDRLKFGSVDFRVELSSEIPSRVGPLEPSRVGKLPGKPKKSGAKGVAVGLAGVVVAALVVVLAGHRLGKWNVPGLPRVVAPPPIASVDPVPDQVLEVPPVGAVPSPRPSATALASATPEPSAMPSPVAVPTPEASPTSVASAPASPTSAVPTPSASGPVEPPSPSAPASASPAPTPIVSAPPTTGVPITSPSPTATLPAPVAPSVPLAVRTATSPYGPRDAVGRPTDLPVVDEGFDFEGFVVAYLGRAAELEAAGRFVEMRQVLAELLVRDPINVEARALRRRADVAEKAAQVLTDGDELRAQGKLMRALEVYAAVPAGTPQGQQAQARIAELRPVAIKRELERVEIELKRDKTWPNAQRRLCAILAVDPDNGDARKMLDDLEPEMRTKGLTPAPCGTGDADEPVGSDGPSPSPSGAVSTAPGVPSPTAAPVSAAARAQAINERWPDRTLQRIVQSYAEGDLAGSIKRADLAFKKGKGTARNDAKNLLASLRRAQTKYERVRNEVGVDPSVAWAQLLELGRIEAEILPDGIESFLVTELERTLADAFAERGAAAFEQERYDLAFTLWDAGFRLNPANTKIQQGIVRLEQLAEKWVKEAELAAQRGQPDACERWRTITRMTRGNAEAHKKARARIGQGC